MLPIESDPAFDALGNRARRAILRLLAEKPLGVTALAERFPVSRPAISRHLAVLRRAGMVRAERLGTAQVYRLDPAGLKRAALALSAFRDEAVPALQALALEPDRD
jgi:DNA-binding transcriptional ArsR family regulator